MRRILTAVVLLWAGCPHAAGAASSPAGSAVIVLEWVGETASAHGRRFALAEDAGGAPRWLGLGDVCDGYALVAYVAEPEMLTLRRGAETLVLTLGRGMGAPAPVDAMTQSVPPVGALEIAAGEARKRDGWDSDVHCEPPQRHDREWWVLVKRTGGGGSEARMVILSAEGRVIDYWRV